MMFDVLVFRKSYSQMVKKQGKETSWKHEGLSATCSTSSCVSVKLLKCEAKIFEKSGQGLECGDTSR